MYSGSKFVDIARNLFHSDAFIPLHAPIFSGNEKKYVLDTIDSTFVSSVGAYVNQFEEQVAKISGVGKSVAVVNGTAALEVALRLVGVKPQDEVLTQALSFVATPNSISYNGAVPVFVDVDRDTMGMSANALQNFLEEFGEIRDSGCYNKKTNKRIAACVPMHTFGFLCRMKEILDICNKWGIPVVEDAAEAIGSVYEDGSRAGALGKLGVYSFNGNKIITAGGGGAIVGSDENLTAKAKYLTTTAKVPHAWEYVHDELGYNYRMPNLNAALVCAQLEQLEDFINNKKALYEAYQRELESLGVNLRSIPGTTRRWNYWLMAVELDSLAEKEKFLEVTNSAGVMTRPIWRLSNELPMYEHCQADSQENAKYLVERIVNIPSSVRP